LFTETLARRPTPLSVAKAAMRCGTQSKADDVLRRLGGTTPPLVVVKDGVVWTERAGRLKLSADERIAFELVATSARWPIQASRDLPTKATSDSLDVATATALAERYVKVFNAVNGRRVGVTPAIVGAVKACLKATPPYTWQQILAAAVMTYADDWYADREPSYPLHFKRSVSGEGKAHLDSLLALITPGRKFPDKIVQIIKDADLGRFFHEKVKP
jgi:sulfur carrier protein ThiS